MNRVAICPKCETFMIVPDHTRSWFCFHVDPYKIKFYEDKVNLYDTLEDIGKKILCKIVTVDCGRVVDGD